MIRALTTVALAFALATGLAGCTTTSRADVRAEAIARTIADDLTPRTPETLDAEHLAERALGVTLSGSPDPTARVEMLGWSGRLGPDEEAVLTLRIRVDLPGEYDRGFAPDVEPSSTVRCWDLVVRFLHDYDPRTWELRGIPCPDDVVALTPDPPPLLTMPDDAEALLRQALDGASVDDVEDRVRAAFADPGYSVLAEEHRGELVVALGVIREHSCVVVVRDAAGDVSRYSGFDQVQLQPGELGCDPGLYLRPVVAN